MRSVSSGGEVARAIVAFAILLCSMGWAKGPSYFGLDLGVYANNWVERFSVAPAYASDISYFTGFIRARPGISLGKNFFLEPSLAAALPWRSGADGSVKVFPFQFDVDLIVPIVSFLAFRAGSGVLSTVTLSSAETVALNNGSPTATSNFSTPGGAVVGFSLTVQAGLVLKVSKRFQFNIDVYALNVASRLRRSFNGAASFGVVF